MGTNNLTDEVMKELDKFKEIETATMMQVAGKVARDARKKLIETSPRGKGKEHYADGWSVKKKRVNSNKFEIEVYNKTKPSLTHLLENGHALRQGGRAPAIKHIKPVEEWSNDEYLKRLEKEL